MSEKKKMVNLPADSKEALLMAAKKVFADKTFAGATVKDLADAAGVNVSLVSYYFGGKEGLYRACLESFGRERLAASERVLKTPESPEDFKLRLRLFIEEFMVCHMQEKDICQIIHRDFESDNPIANDVFKEIFIHVFLKFSEFVASAQKAKILRKDMDHLITASIIFGSLVHSLKMDHKAKMLLGRSLENLDYREKFIAQFIRHHTEGLFRGDET